MVLCCVDAYTPASSAPPSRQQEDCPRGDRCSTTFHIARREQPTMALHIGGGQHLPIGDDMKFHSELVALKPDSRRSIEHSCTLNYPVQREISVHDLSQELSIIPHPGPVGRRSPNLDCDLSDSPFQYQCRPTVAESAGLTHAVPDPTWQHPVADKYPLRGPSRSLGAEQGHLCTSRTE
jgi:hypothetical protein